MVSDDELLTREATEALGRAAEPLSAHARAQIRERVMSEVRTDSRGGLFMLASHRVAVAATALAMLGSGVAYAAERALPGDPLYGLKTATEQAAVSILPPGKLENRLLVGIAGRRAAEAARVAHAASGSKAEADALEALRHAVHQATPTEGELAEKARHHIRERAADAPAHTREAIEDAVSAPAEHRTEPQGDSGSEPVHRDVDEGHSPDQSHKRDESPHSR